MPLYRRKPGGVWWVRIGRKTRKSTRTTDRRQAEEFEEILRRRLWRQRELGDRSALSWSEAAQKWLKASRRKRTRDRQFIAWLAPRIGNESISAVADAEALEQLQEDGLSEGWTHSTVDRMMRTVRAVLRFCWKKKQLPTQPYVPQFGNVQAEPHFLTAEQFRRLCAELPTHLNLAARFAVLTLLRRNSQARLTWDRIDLEKRHAWVPGEHIKSGKPFGISLSDEAIEILKECRRLWPTGDAVFQYKGKRIGSFNTRAFQKAARRCGLRPLRWHDLRHTGASWAVQNGVTLQELMALGNWKSYASVLIYAHLAPSNSAKAAQIVSQTVVHALAKTGTGK
jgi:integrase